MRLYFDFRAAKQPYGAEALGLMSYSLREQSILFTLTVEFWMTLSQAEQRNLARLQGMQETKAAAAMLTGSALDYLGLTAQFERQDLVLYSAELAKEMPELFIHLPSPVRAQLLERIAAFAKDHPYPGSATTCATCNRCCRRSRPTWKNSWRPGGTPRHRTNPWT